LREQTARRTEVPARLPSSRATTKAFIASIRTISSYAAPAICIVFVTDVAAHIINENL
jgi:uncharacterized protein involved in tolerance to divalent cations